MVFRTALVISGYRGPISIGAVRSVMVHPRTDWVWVPLNRIIKSTGFIFVRLRWANKFICFRAFGVTMCLLRAGLMYENNVKENASKVERKILLCEICQHLKWRNLAEQTQIVISEYSSSTATVRQKSGYSSSSTVQYSSSRVQQQYIYSEAKVWLE